MYTYPFSHACCISTAITVYEYLEYTRYIELAVRAEDDALESGNKDTLQEYRSQED